MEVWRNSVHQIAPLALFCTRTAKGCIRRIIDLSSRPKLIAAIVVCGSAGYAIGSLIHNAQQRRNLKLMFTTLNHPIRSCVMWCSEVLIPSIFLMEAQDIYLSFYGREMAKNNMRIILILISVQLSITFVTDIQPRMCYTRFMDVSFLPLSAVGLLLGQFDHKQDASAIMCMIAAINKVTGKLYLTIYDFSFIFADDKNLNEGVPGGAGGHEDAPGGAGDNEGAPGGAGGNEGAPGGAGGNEAASGGAGGNEGGDGSGNEGAPGGAGSNNGTDSGHESTDSDDDDENYNKMGEKNIRNEGSEGDRDGVGNDHYDSGDDPDYVPSDHEDEESSEHSDEDEKISDEEVQDLLFEQYGEQQGSSGEQEKKDLEKGEKYAAKVIEKDEQQDKMLRSTNQNERPLVEDLQEGIGLPKANVHNIEIDFNVEQERESSLVVYEKNLEQKIENFCEEDSSKKEISSEIVEREDNESLEGMKDICSPKVSVQTGDKPVDVRTDKSKPEKSFHKEETSEVSSPVCEKSTEDEELKNEVLEDVIRERS